MDKVTLDVATTLKLGYRCPSINPWDATDRCKLRGDDPHGYGHEGVFRGRNIFWDFSPITVTDDSPDRWVRP